MLGQRWCSSTILAAIFLITVLPVSAQNHTCDIDNSDVSGQPVEQPHPLFPGSDIRSGQDGGVRLHFIISPQGRAPALLAREIGSSAGVAVLREHIAEMEQRLTGAELLRATAMLYNHCDCDAGEPVWACSPVRQTFSFDALSGNVKRLEVRCEHDRLQGAVDADKRWTLPEEAGSCRVFVFGDDGARFEFVEHGDAQTEDPAATPPAVARNDVLDRRN